MTVLYSIPSEHRPQPGEAEDNWEEEQSQLTPEVAEKCPMDRNTGLAVAWEKTKAFPCRKPWWDCVPFW